MNELYWIMVADNIRLGLILFFVFTFIVGTAFMAECHHSKSVVITSAICWLFGLLSLIGWVFIPNTRQATIIYGMSNIIEYIKVNDTAKQLPDKAVYALDKFLEDYIKGNN